MLLRRPGWGRVALGAVARVLWYLFGVPCAWSLPRGAERQGASWGASGDGEDALRHDDCDASSPHASRVDALRCAFALAGASGVPHVAGAFDEHLADVSRVLASWGLPEHVALAGYGHTLYGSELFPCAMGSFSVAARRATRAAIGRDAETLVFLYGTCSQKRWYRSVLDERFDDVVFDETSDDGRWTVPEQINVYTGEKTRLSKTRFAFLCAVHAADIASTLPSRRRESRTSRGGATKRASSETPSSARAFVARLLRVAAAAVRSDPDVDARRRFPGLARALTRAADDTGGHVIGSDATKRRLETDAATRLRRCAFDASLVTRAAGLIA